MFLSSLNCVCVCADFGGCCVVIDFVFVVVIDDVVESLAIICGCCVEIFIGDLLMP